MVKKFTYRGLSNEELNGLSMENMLKLFPARIRRSLTRGIDENKRKLVGEIKASKAGKNITIRTHCRDLIILPNMVGVTISVFSGKEFVPVTITLEMVGHYLGEYVITNKRVSHGAPGVGSSRSSLYVPLKWENMPEFNYAFQNFDPTRHVRAALREKTISHKHSREIAVAIKGLNVEKARDYLIHVIQLKRSIPFRRYKNQVGHKSDPGTMSGRYPQKAATEVLKLLDNLESNAEYKGMDLDRLKIINATVHKGRIMKRFIPRAQGRATPKNNVYTHIELVAREA